MQYLGRVAGIAAIALGAIALSSCYAPPPPPPIAAIEPAQPAPPPAYPLVATGAPTPLTAPSNTEYGLPQYGSTTAPGYAPSSAGTMTGSVAPYGPPPLQVETPPAPPAALAMWQPGHWRWNGSQYAWAPGHYVERPAPTANWLPGYWQQGAGGWTWVEGHWAS